MSYAYFKHEETPEGVLYAVDLLESCGAEIRNSCTKALLRMKIQLARTLLVTFAVPSATRILIPWLLMPTRACYPASSTTCASSGAPPS